MPEAAYCTRVEGLRHPERVRRLINDFIAHHELDLCGLTVFTEAATRNYLVTPILAAKAGARRVLALAKDSRYGSAEAVAGLVEEFAVHCGVAQRVEVVREKAAEGLGEADIVTNLGFVRPIDAETVARMKPLAVVPLMCESWELRPGDVDVKACRSRGIMVVGTNEHDRSLDVFDFSGVLCMKLLLEAEIEVRKSRVVVISSDPFGKSIARSLQRNDARVHCMASLRDRGCLAALQDADALVVADYLGGEVLIGAHGQLDIGTLQAAAPGITVIQFAGRVDTAGLLAAGIPCVPAEASSGMRMGQTFDALGPRPVIELHGAGLKVAERVCRARAAGASEAQALRRAGSLAQAVRHGGPRG